jgi:predicted secreted Zn-dependent protease
VQAKREVPSLRWLLALAGLLLTRLAALPADAPNKLVWTTNYYAVTGATLPEIHQSLNRPQPWKTKPELVGLTTWHIDWQFDLQRTAGGCRCTSFTTRTTITNILPHWIAPTNAAPEVKKAWARLFARLARHEDGHSRLALAAVAELHQRVKKLGEDTDCRGLRRKINDLAHRVIEEHRRREAEYDRRTNHGAGPNAPAPR